jgi:outer membrane protein TolC
VLFNRGVLFLLLGTCAGVQGACLSLEEAERVALENNKQVKMVEQLYERSKQHRLEAFSKWFPTLLASTEAYRTPGSHPPNYGGKNQFLTQLSLMQTLFDSDTYYGVKIASLEKEQLKMTLEAAVNDALYAVREAYYRVILDYETLGVAEEHVALLTRLAERMSDRYRIGTAILYNVNQSKVAIANATTRYYQVQKELKSDIDLLVKVLGFDPGTEMVTFPKIDLPILEIPEIAEKVSLVENIFKERGGEDALIYKEGFPRTEQIFMSDLFTEREMRDWEIVALNYRPSLRESKKKVEVASEIVRSRRGKYLPSLDLYVNYGGIPTPNFFFPSTKFNDQTFDLGVGVNLNWTLFDGLGRERRIDMALSQRNADMYGYEDQIQTTLAEVRRQIFDMEEAVSHFITTQGIVALAEQTLEQSFDQFDVGYITIFDYQIAIDNLVQAKNSRNRAKFDLLTSYYGLRHASGIDLQQWEEDEKR